MPAQPESSLVSPRLLGYMLGIVGSLAVANGINYAAGEPYWTITRLIHLGYDNNFAAWYSATLLTVAAFLAYSCCRVAELRCVSGRSAFLVFALLLMVMSCDEIVDAHAILGGLLARYGGIFDKQYACHSPWVWIGGPVVMAVFVFFGLYLRRVMSLVPRSFAFMVIGFILIFVGGVLLEGATNWFGHASLQWLWNVETVMEESLEMVGTLSISYSLLLWRDGLPVASPSARDPAP